jgi:hypothetical protein
MVPNKLAPAIKRKIQKICPQGTIQREREGCRQTERENPRNKFRETREGGGGDGVRARERESKRLCVRQAQAMGAGHS